MFRWRIALLTLGVVLGYGSAIAHFAHWHGHGYGYGHGHCRDHWSSGPWSDAPPQPGHEKPSKPVQ